MAKVVPGYAAWVTEIYFLKFFSFSMLKYFCNHYTCTEKKIDFTYNFSKWNNSKDKVFYYMFLFHTCKLNMVLLIML